ncbi:MAG: arginase [Rhodothermales bacterium]|jgi:arginase
MIRLLGIPYDASSSFKRGPAHGPDAVREALQSPSANAFAEDGAEWPEGAWHDVGSVAFQTPGGTRWDGSPEAAKRREAERDLITREVARHLAESGPLLSIGGDHSVSFPVLRAFAARHPGLTIVHLDAHADLYDQFEGDRFSHACPFARIMEDGLATRLVQVGVRTLTTHQRAQGDRFGVETLEMRHGFGPLPPVEGPIYVSLDLDVLDPAFAPGVSHHEPGGPSTRDVIGMLQGLEGRIVGADIVELNPARDIQGVTAMVAAKLARELMAAMARGQ